jgi:ubiquinol-cytochrome c reductase cytochrome b subunit
LEGPIKEAVPTRFRRNTASWWYVFGSASFVLLLLQIVTGILLAIVYVPSAGEAWNSLQVLNQQLPLGWFLRAMHGWGSNFMVAVVLDPHGAGLPVWRLQVSPRADLDPGCLSAADDAGHGFTGQVMRFDQDAYWGLGIGASIVSRVPFIGGQAGRLLLGGPSLRVLH